jgi:hypothetical protein
MDVRQRKESFEDRVVLLLALRNMNANLSENVISL